MVVVCLAVAHVANAAQLDAARRETPGAEAPPGLRQHAPAEEPLRSAALARATRELSIITQRGLASLLLAAEPRPVAARVA